MLGSQEAISIPVAYIETFAMTFGAFLIGYFGASLYHKWLSKRRQKTQTSELEALRNKVKNLQDELDRKADGVFRKDRMDEEYEYLQVRNRAFSDEVISEKVVEKEILPTINFERIGRSSAAERNELQQIVGIGPYTEAKLNELGIYSFDQISKFTNEDIEIVTKLIKFFPDRIKNDRWVEKAKRLKEITREDTDGDLDDSKKKIPNKKPTY